MISYKPISIPLGTPVNKSKFQIYNDPINHLLQNDESWHISCTLSVGVEELSNKELLDFNKFETVYFQNDHSFIIKRIDGIFVGFEFGIEPFDNKLSYLGFLSYCDDWEIFYWDYLSDEERKSLS